MTLGTLKVILLAKMASGTGANPLMHGPDGVQRIPARAGKVRPGRGLGPRAVTRTPEMASDEPTDGRLSDSLSSVSRQMRGVRLLSHGAARSSPAGGGQARSLETPQTQHFPWRRVKYIFDWMGASISGPNRV